MGLTLASKYGRRRGGGYRCDDLDCPLCGDRNRADARKREERQQEKERRREERRSLHGWRWLKHFLRLDGSSERRNGDRR